MISSCILQSRGSAATGDIASPIAFQSQSASSVWRNPARTGLVLRRSPLLGSVEGGDRDILPMAAEYGAAVIGMALDDEGIPRTPEARLAVAQKIVERAEAAGVPRQDVVIDCMALSVSTDPEAGRVTLEAVRSVRERLGVNLTLGPSNVSFGLPERENLHWAFMAMAIQNGVNCPIVNVSRDRPFILAIDVLLGRDPYADRYIAAYRERSKSE